MGETVKWLVEFHMAVPEGLFTLFFIYSENDKDVIIEP